jgi:hypothetical protein
MVDIVNLIAFLEKGKQAKNCSPTKEKVHETKYWNLIPYLEYMRA